MSVGPDLVAFIRETFRSIWSLELLLLLKADPDRTWRPEALVRELRASELIVTGSLAELERAGLVVCDGDRWRYAAPGVLLPALCDQVEQAYRERPVTVINVISATPQSLLRLADAFRIRGTR